MPFCLPETACTPEGYRPRFDIGSANPLNREKSLDLDIFFVETHPSQWLPEVYAEHYGGSTEGFVKSLRIMGSWRHFPHGTFVRNLLQYCESERGKNQLALLSTLSAFQVKSDDLAANAGSRSADGLKEILNRSTSTTDVNRNSSLSRTDGDKARLNSKAEKDHFYISSTGTHLSSSWTPPYQYGSKSVSPTLSPPEHPQFQETTSEGEDEGEDGDEDEHNQNGVPMSHTSNIFQDDTPTGTSLSTTWIQERPVFTFKLQLQNDWGPKVTKLYNAAKTKTSFTHKDLDEISLLTGVLHINKTHIGLQEDDIVAIRKDVLARFYTPQMQARDIQRAEHATTFWNSITQKWRSLKFQHDLAKASGAPNPNALSTEPVLDMIMEAYMACKGQEILPIHSISQYVYRHLDDWGTLESELDAMSSVIAPILQEILRIPGQIKFKCLNTACSVGRTRKAALEQDGQARKPDVVGRTKDRREVYFGELKGPHPRTLSKDADLLRLAVFTKDALDPLSNELEQDPPILSFQSVGRTVTFYLGAKIDNTVFHIRLSEVNLPSLLTELDLDQGDFYHLFQAETLVRITSDRLQRKRDKPLTDIPFPTLATPQRDVALGIKHKV
ncbi:hypothetical protein BGZ80_000184 [Entomortierella chlamydospora]|uniref:Uncharacterized protein n=1 Tax=Entomortierella chlamydospora TaxID=101097 RepID=A0A9P6MT19_9FUNG|nr:hypothetical protein BGZ80_000184 [Entomortierella chlamydospora]